MSWPNDPWHALSSAIIDFDDDKYALSTVDCGLLKLPSGKLISVDPFAGLSKENNPYVQVPAGEYKVVVTLADVSSENDGSHIREAYASIIIDGDKKEVTRKCLQPTLNGMPTNEVLADGEYFGFAVDAGTACFVDAESLPEGMPDESEWYETLFENDKPDCWFSLMDDPKNIRSGIANIPLPLSQKNNNLVLFHSGWGDGYYPVIGGFDEKGDLINVHIDFFVASQPKEDEEEGSHKKPWWKFW